jgi:hypothetical protein
MRSSGPNAEEGQQQAFGPEVEKEEHFFISNFQLHFQIVFEIIFFLK